MDIFRSKIFPIFRIIDQSPIRIKDAVAVDSGYKPPAVIVNSISLQIIGQGPGSGIDSVFLNLINDAPAYVVDRLLAIICPRGCNEAISTGGPPQVETKIIDRRKTPIKAMDFLFLKDFFSPYQYRTPGPNLPLPVAFEQASQSSYGIRSKFPLTHVSVSPLILPNSWTPVPTPQIYPACGGRRSISVLTATLASPTFRHFLDAQNPLFQKEPVQKRQERRGDSSFRTADASATSGFSFLSLLPVSSAPQPLFFSPLCRTRRPHRSRFVNRFEAGGSHVFRHRQEDR